jgi:hypothetical protein
MPVLEPFCYAKEKKTIAAIDDIIAKTEETMTNIVRIINALRC